MNAFIKSLAIIAAFCGLLGGTPASVQASTKNPVVVAAEQQLNREVVSEEISMKAMAPGSDISSLLNPFVVAARQQLHRELTSELTSIIGTMPESDISSLRNAFAVAAEKQLQGGSMAGETR